MNEMKRTPTAGPPSQNRLTHLYRGAPLVRSWSKYQTTDQRWTLCGVDRRISSRRGEDATRSTETPDLVSCIHCLQLMRPTTTARTRKASAAAQ
jgi:hypothetical protein